MIQALFSCENFCFNIDFLTFKSLGNFNGKRGVINISLPQVLFEENPPGQTKARPFIWRPLLS